RVMIRGACDPIGPAFGLGAAHHVGGCGDHSSPPARNDSIPFAFVAAGVAATRVLLLGVNPNSALILMTCSMALFATARYGFWIGKPEGDFTIGPCLRSCDSASIIRCHAVT